MILVCCLWEMCVCLWGGNMHIYIFWQVFALQDSIRVIIFNEASSYVCMQHMYESEDILYLEGVFLNGLPM